MTNARALAAKLASRHPDPGAAMRAWGFTESPVAAYDSKAGLHTAATVVAALKSKFGTTRNLAKSLGLDEDLLDAPEEVDPDEIAAVLEFLQNKLTAEQLNQLTEWLGQNYPRSEETDQPPPFEGRPERGGGAMDAGFYIRFPAARRITGETPRDHFADWKRQQKRDRIAHDARPVSSFETRYPHSRRIGRA
jgi:hypothetical protein